MAGGGGGRKGGGVAGGMKGGRGVAGPSTSTFSSGSGSFSTDIQDGGRSSESETSSSMLVSTRLVRFLLSVKAVEKKKYF